MQDQGGSPHMLVELVVDCSSVGDEKRDLMAMVVEIMNMARPELYQGGFHNQCCSSPQAIRTKGVSMRVGSQGAGQ
jgi:hypothetical protein